jgi:predicted small integral membrane protein
MSDDVAALCRAQMLLVATITAMLGLVVFSNITDDGTNVEFVKHVMGMDTRGAFLPRPLYQGGR